MPASGSVMDVGSPTSSLRVGAGTVQASSTAEGGTSRLRRDWLELGTSSGARLGAASASAALGWEEGPAGSRRPSLAGRRSGRRAGTRVARVARLGRSRRLGCEDAVPVELDVRVLLFEHPNRVFVKRRAADFHVRRRAKPVQQLRLFRPCAPLRRVEQVRALVPAPVARESQGRHALLALGDRLGAALADGLAAGLADGDWPAWPQADLGACGAGLGTSGGGLVPAAWRAWRLAWRATLAAGLTTGFAATLAGVSLAGATFVRCRALGKRGFRWLLDRRLPAQAWRLGCRLDGAVWPQP